MYIPRHFLNNNDDEVISFMQKYSFGTIITSDNNVPVASHLPFLVEKSQGQVVISSHFAKANPQAQFIEIKPVMIIFSEPHAYISPRHYEKEQNVPTWNYISVHVYGKCSIVQEKEMKLDLLERTILNYEAGYNQQWKELSFDFKEKMLNGIIAFNVEVTEIQPKYKLSQNKTTGERESIINELSNSTASNEVDIAEYMKLNITK